MDTLVLVSGLWLNLWLFVVYKRREERERRGRKRQYVRFLCTTIGDIAPSFAPHFVTTPLFFAGLLCQSKNIGRKSATLGEIIGSPVSYIMRRSQASPDTSSDIILFILCSVLPTLCKYPKFFLSSKKSQSRSIITCSPIDPPISISGCHGVSQSGLSDKMTPRFAG
ncbi:hypothetical protein EDD36DRAFT_137524 [Exophiala viscosa]|uniref:Uncharacterized protein n=1 Tax=Exophiala viscosa TaxID=2486360 RepID=A0AAN6IGC2_9EURO|nr:hypothetical protein EDD36DRAFT_137524 [Exophiala viscosa]